MLPQQHFLSTLVPSSSWHVAHPVVILANFFGLSTPFSMIHPHSRHFGSKFEIWHRCWRHLTKRKLQKKKETIILKKKKETKQNQTKNAVWFMINGIEINIDGWCWRHDLSPDWSELIRLFRDSLLENCLGRLRWGAGVTQVDRHNHTELRVLLSGWLIIDEGVHIVPFVWLI